MNVILSKEQLVNVQTAIIESAANEVRMSKRSQGVKELRHMDASREYNELSIKLSRLTVGDTITIE